MCEIGLAYAQGNTTLCKTVKSKSQSTDSEMERFGWLLSGQESWLANTLQFGIERNWLGFYKKADVGF